MLYVDKTVFIQVGNFLVLLFLLNRILYRPVRKILGQRGEEMNSLQSAIGDYRTKVEHLTKDLEENLTGARKEGFREKESLKQTGLSEEKDMLHAAASSAGEKIMNAREEIERKAREARDSLEKDLALFAKEVAEKIMGRSI